MELGYLSVVALALVAAFSAGVLLHLQWCAVGIAHADTLELLDDWR